MIATLAPKHDFTKTVAHIVLEALKVSPSLKENTRAPCDLVSQSSLGIGAMNTQTSFSKPDSQRRLADKVTWGPSVFRRGRTCPLFLVGSITETMETGGLKLWFIG